MTAVVYLVRGADPGWLDSARRFLHSYEARPAGLDHELVLLIKGFGPGEEQPLLADFAGVAARTLTVGDDSFDLGAYRDAAASLPHRRRLCLLNTGAELLAGDWLAKLARNLDRPGVGLVGATGSFESNSPGLPGFDPFPNLHLRTNAILAERSDILRMTEGRPIREKLDAYRLESGPDSLTRQVLRSGRAVLVVGADGRGYPPASWPRSRTFRLGRQDNLLVGDGQTRAFATLAWPDRMRVAQATWGPHLAVPPPPGFGRPVSAERHGSADVRADREDGPPRA